MRYWLLAIVFLLALERAYTVGRAVGVKSSPEYAAAKVRKAELDDQYWREMEAQETDRDRVCEAFFDAAEGIISAEALDDLRQEVWRDRP